VWTIAYCTVLVSTVFHLLQLRYARRAAHQVDASAIHEKSHPVFHIIPVTEVNSYSIINETDDIVDLDDEQV
jgi:hypothetical protein